MSEWPASNAVASLTRKLLDENPNRNNMLAYRDFKNLQKQNASQKGIIAWAKKSFLKLNVFSNSRTVSVKEEIPLYTQTELLSQLGGCLGLWLGISVVTCAELLHLVFTLVFWKVQNMSNLVTANETIHVKPTKTVLQPEKEGDK